jgi:hypothetical protein
VVFHFLLSVKGDLFRLQGNIGRPILYGSIALLLLALRIPPVKRTLTGARTRLQGWFARLFHPEAAQPGGKF